MRECSTLERPYIEDGVLAVVVGVGHLSSFKVLGIEHEGGSDINVSTSAVELADVVVNLLLGSAILEDNDEF